jgi:hypothetical protein
MKEKGTDIEKKKGLEGKKENWDRHGTINCLKYDKARP